MLFPFFYKTRFYLLHFFRSFYSCLLASWYRCGGLVIGKSARLTSGLIITWPNQVNIGSSFCCEHNVYFQIDGVFSNTRILSIGNNCFVGANAHFNLRIGASIGDNVLIASGVRLIDHDHNISGQGSFIATDGVQSPIVISSDVWLGSDVTVLKGVCIGQGAVIGAGSVVTKNVPSNEIWAGVPAKRIGFRRVLDLWIFPCSAFLSCLML